MTIKPVSWEEYYAQRFGYEQLKTENEISIKKVRRILND